MSGPKALSRLHVFRSLEQHIRQRWGVGLVLVAKSEATFTLTRDEDGVLPLLAQQLGEEPGFTELHETALRSMLESRDGRLVDHPGGFQMVGVPCPIGGRTGRLVALPFLLSEPGDERIAQLAERLGEAGMARTKAAGLAERLPLMARPALTHLLELMRLLAAEATTFADTWARSERRLDKLRSQGRGRYMRIIGRSLPMLELFSLIDKIVQTDSTVYIHGENGTGKELVAREIHLGSRRADQAFIVQNCSALNDNLLESELFGHRRGAFTGAIQDKPGLFALADDGSFFLDEIGDMSPALQVKLLRVLQEGTFTPVGGTDVRRVDVRVICATNRNLRQMVKDGTFREDLYYRINVINLAIPPLRDRMEDIPVLIEFFLERAMQVMGNPGGKKRLSKDAQQRLMEYDWPGNVRELENEMERLVVLTGPLIATIGEELLSAHIRTRALSVPPIVGKDGLSLPDALERIERSMIYEQLKDNRWNKTKAAAALGISRRNLIRKVKQYDFDRRAADD